MECPDVIVQDSRLKRDEDAIAVLQDAVPQLESLFVISHAIGNGTFSSVYFARTKHTTTINGRRHFAVKHIIPTSHPSRIFMELKCLKMMGGTDNVMGVTMCFREMNHIVIVMPYFPHDSFSDYVGCLTTSELQDYLRNLLIALRRVHSFGIIHRDVKPANFLFNRKHQRYSLVDFGLAQEVALLRGYPQNRTVIKGKEAAIHLLSPPTVDTPHLSSNKTAKRKLTVGSRDDNECDKNKRSRHFSPPTSASGGVLSTTTNRVNTGQLKKLQLFLAWTRQRNLRLPSLRRSPRKQCSLHVSPKKENLITPIKGNSSGHAIQDSPSKHTRNAESLPKSGSHKDNNGLKTPNLNVQMRKETMRGLRRSPRKSVSSASNVPLEGLARNMQEASSSNATAKTPSMRAGSSRMDSTASTESSCASRALPQRPRQAMGCSPRVSGITDVRSHYQDKVHSVKGGKVLQEVRTKSGSMLQPVSCHCYGSARVCSVCIGRSNQHAPRAGTPGFRAPEVLLRHPEQGTAVDMWSVGVILLCLLSGRYPFFRAADDLSTLAEITTLLGSYSIRKAASKFGKLFTCSEERKPLDLTKVCDVLRNNTLLREAEKQGVVNEQKEKCNGCRQSLCVCLIPPRMDNLLLNHGYSATKKCSQSLEANLLKEQHLKHMNDSLKMDISQPVNRVNYATDNQNFPFGNVRPPAVDVGEVCVSAEQVCKSIKPEDSTLVIQSGKPVKISKESTYPSSVFHLLYRFLDPDPEMRISAEEAMDHPFLKLSPL